MQSDLDRQNAVVLQTVQALLGNISADMRAISVNGEPPDGIVLHIWASQVNPELRADAQEIVSELEALSVQQNLQMEVQFHVGSPSSDWPEWAGRMVYWAKEEQ